MRDWYPEILKLRGHVTALETENKQLQAKLDTVEKVIVDLDTQSTNSHAVRLLRKALQEQEDG